MVVCAAGGKKRFWAQKTANFACERSREDGFFFALFWRKMKKMKKQGGGETEMMATRPIHSFLLFSNATKDWTNRGTIFSFLRPSDDKHCHKQKENSKHTFQHKLFLLVEVHTLNTKKKKQQQQQQQQQPYYDGSLLCCCCTNWKNGYRVFLCLCLFFLFFFDGWF